MNTDYWVLLRKLEKGLSQGCVAHRRRSAKREHGVGYAPRRSPF
jgi:hypothetical protein